MSLAERIAQRYHCIGCGRRYRPEDLQLVGVGNDELDLYIHCTSCGLFLQLTVPEQELAAGVVAASIPRSTPSPAQEKEAAATAPVTAEDVLAIRQYLTSFEGDVHRLLGARDAGP